MSKWLEDPIVTDESRELDARDRAVVRFAGSLLKRALSESFAGVPVQEGEPQPFIDANDVTQQHKLALAVRSLSLELARQKNRRQQSVSSNKFLQTCEQTTELERFEFILIKFITFCRNKFKCFHDFLTPEK